MAGKLQYRERALEELHSPENLDELIVLTSPRTWLAVVLMGLLITGVLVWGWFGTVTRGVEGHGILVQEGGVRTVQARGDGYVLELLVEIGSEVAADQPIARVVEPDGKTRDERSAYSGRVVDLLVNGGQPIERGEALATIVDDSARLEVLLYLPPALGKQVDPGMAVGVSPSTIPREVHGYIVGRVASVSDYPKTRQGMLRELQNERLVDSLSAEGAPIEVIVELERADTPSGFAWSSGRGPERRVSSGTFTTARITTQALRPLSLVFPSMAREPK